MSRLPARGTDPPVDRREMLGLEEFSRVVSQVHATTTAPERWPAALADLSRHLDAAACTLAVGQGHDRVIYATNINPEAASSYESHYYRMDFIAADCEKSPVGLVNDGWKLVAANKRTEFHADWQRRYGMTDGLQVRLSATTPATLFVSAPPRNEPYATAERVNFVNALVPHIRQALAARRHIDHGGRGGVDFGAAEDLIRHAVIIVGRDGRLARMNSAARQLTATADGLSVRGDRVRASASAMDNQLQAAIGRALASREGHPRVGGLLVCGRPSGKRPYIVRLVPLDTELDPRRAHAAIVIIDPDQQLAPSKPLLQKMFGLTATEYEVATRMLRGDELKTIAEDLSVSLATVRTHVQRLFSKTGTNRQVELVRLLFAIAS